MTVFMHVNPEWGERDAQSTWNIQDQSVRTIHLHGSIWFLCKENMMLSNSRISFLWWRACLFGMRRQEGGSDMSRRPWMTWTPALGSYGVLKRSLSRGGWGGEARDWEGGRELRERAGERGWRKRETVRMGVMEEGRKGGSVGAERVRDAQCSVPSMTPSHTD